MNNKEQWIKWSPGEAFEKKYTKKELIMNWDFRILAEDESKATKDILIGDGALIFRVTDINYCLPILEHIDQTYGENFHSKWTFFKVENSDYVKWLHYESLEIVDLNINHFAFVFTNCIVDMVIFREPEIKEVC